MCATTATYGMAILNTCHLPNEHLRTPHHPLRANNRQSPHTTRNLEQVHLRGPSTNQPRKNTIIAVLPLGQLLRGNQIWVLSDIQPPNKRRVPRCPTSDVERPADQCAILVVVERDGVGSLLGDAVLGDLEGLIRLCE